MALVPSLVRSDGSPWRKLTGTDVVAGMEDECWCDINLSSDPNLPDGGKANGLGSLWEYELHCKNEGHIKCRDQRLKNMVSDAFPPFHKLNPQGVLIPPADSIIPPIPSMASNEAGPSRLAASSPSRPASQSTMMTPFRSFTSSGLPASAPPPNVLRDHPINIPTSPTKQQYRDVVDSDSEGSIEFVGASSPRKNVIVLSGDEGGSSDSDVKPIPSSQASRPSLKSSQRSSSSRSQNRKFRDSRSELTPS